MNAIFVDLRQLVLERRWKTFNIANNRYLSGINNFFDI